MKKIILVLICIISCGCDSKKLECNEVGYISGIGAMIIKKHSYSGMLYLNKKTVYSCQIPENDYTITLK